MASYQQRVVEEKTDLDAKLAALRAFLPGDVAKTLSQAELNRLMRQESAMSYYSVVLGERIAAFTDPQIETLSTLNAGVFTQRTPALIVTADDAEGSLAAQVAKIGVPQ